MKRNFYIVVVLLLTGLFYSCKKNPVSEVASEAQWIKVVSDSAVFFTGKIKADQQNNLFCSYFSAQSKFSIRSAILKLDAAGNLLWRKEFDSIAIYDFVLNDEGDLIVASALNNTITLRKVFSINTSSVILGSCELVPDGIPTKGITQMKITRVGANYTLSGTMMVTAAGHESAGFMIALSEDASPLWQHAYLLEPDAPTSTAVTGCTQTSEGDYILFGSVQYADPLISKFFVMKCDATGNITWTKLYTTCRYDAGFNMYYGYYCGTSDIVADESGNLYACAFNVLYNTPWQLPVPIHSEDDNSARIFKMDADGELQDSILVKFDVQNQVADLVLKKDGGLFIGLNPNKLGNFDIVGERHSFIANVSREFELQDVTAIQNQYTDYLGSVCATPDGHYAVESMIQSLGKEYYKLQVIKTDVNGNF